MADTIAPISVGLQWISANAASGINVGREMSIQNLGRASDVVLVWIGDTAPTESSIGMALKQFETMFIDRRESEVWVSFSDNRVFKRSTGRQIFVSVQDAR
jgi:hypothetical protein